MNSKKPLFNEKDDWTFPLLKKTYDVIENIALNDFKLDVYPNQIEIIDSEQMLEAYTSVGMPNYYKHWSYGKAFESQKKQYTSGYSNLAYEIVINCLSSKTKVYIENKGFIPLSSVIVGDKIFDGSKFVTILNKTISQKKTKRILLDDGTEIFATPEHIFPIVNQKGRVELPVKDIKVDDYLLSYDAQYPYIKTTAYLNEFEYIPPMNGFGEKFLFNPYCEIPAFMNSNLAELMGVIIGDGSMSNSIGKSFYIAVGWDAGGYENYLKDLIFNTFKIEAKVYTRQSQKHPEKSNYVVYVCSNEIKEFLDYAGLKRDFTHKNKRIPWSIFESDHICQARFLKGLFDTDGCIKATKKENGETSFSGISFSCYNPELAKDVHLLLSSLGIANRLKHVKNDHNNIQSIEILAGGAKKFQELIQPAVIKKYDRLQNYLDKQTKFAADYSSISKIPEYFLNKYNSKRNRKQFISENDLNQEDLWLKDFRTVKIVLIEENTLEEVVDLTVDSENHLFLANNILTHNCDPCIAYLQENNTMTMQSLVIAHASFGHNAVFKGNEYFRTWTQAGSIMDYLSFARQYISKCETLYGSDEVELFLDSCHALQYHGINTYKKKVVTRKQMIEKLEQDYEEEQLSFNPSFANILDKTIRVPKSTDIMIKPRSNKDNILYFIEKNSPALPEWKREIIRIVRTISQYFYPQMITKVLNEGFATYTHYRIMEKMHERGFIDDGSWMEFVLSHTNVIAQSGISYGQFGGWNPYSLGYAIFTDIERICTKPTEEDKYFFPELIGQNPIDATSEAMKNFNDSGFISQYLSPKVIRDFKMFTLFDESKHSQNYVVSSVSDENGYNDIKNALATQYERNYSIPNIEVVGANLFDDRKLVLKYNSYRDRKLNEATKQKMLKHLRNLWGYDVIIE